MVCGAVRVCDGQREEVDLLLPRDGHLVLRELLQREARELVGVERLRLQPQREARGRPRIARRIARELRGNRKVFACFASANIAYTFEIPNGACEREGRPWDQTWALRVGHVGVGCGVGSGVGSGKWEWPLACSLKRSLRRKREMLNTVSGVSAVNGSSVYLRARGDAGNERDGVPCVHASSQRPGGDGRRCTCGRSCTQSTW